eukprot:PITA_35840
MLKRLREVKTALGAMVIFEFWSFWRKTDQVASKRVKDTVLDDAWWERVDLIIQIMDLIISLLRFADTDKPILGEDILVSRWDKNCTPLHCLAHSLNPKYYNDEWLNGGPSRRFPSHMDDEISKGRKDAFRQVFQDRALLDEVEDAFAEFSTGTGRFAEYDVIRDRGAKKPYSW